MSLSIHRCVGQTAWLLLFALAAGLKLWLVGAQTLTPLGTTVHDDRLFVDLAVHILDQGWLGPYDERTLVKGVFYPLWLAGCARLGVPQLLALQLLYLAACGLLTLALRPVIASRAVLLVLFVVLLFNPISYDHWAVLRVIRAGLYAALTLAVVASAIGLYLRRSRAWRSRMAWSLALGLSLAAFWLTREEGVWLMPALALLLALTAWALRERRWPSLPGLTVCLLPVALWLGALALVAGLNRYHYGTATLIELRAQPFAAAYGALTRVVAPRWRRYVAVPRAVREQLYRVSPAFAELRGYFEGEPGRLWIDLSRENVGVADDISNAYFFWALRDAAARAGYHRSLQTAEAYYSRLAAEIDRACVAGALRCAPARSGLRPPWRQAYLQPLLSALWRCFAFLIHFEGFQAYPMAGMGSDEALELYRRITLEELALPVLRGALYLRGVAFAPHHPLHIVVTDAAGGPLARAREHASEEVYWQFRYRKRYSERTRQAQFTARVECAVPCFLEIHAQRGRLRRIPLDGGFRSRFEDSPELFFFLEAQARRDKRIDALAGLGEGYRRLMPWLSLIALGGYLLVAGRLLRARHERPAVKRLYWIATALGLAIGARLALLAAIEATSFPAINTQYLAPAYPLLLAFVVLALLALSGDAARLMRGIGSPDASGFLNKFNRSSRIM